MKKLMVLSGLIIIAVSIVGCNNNQKKENTSDSKVSGIDSLKKPNYSDSIIGKWKSTTNPDVVVEFTKSHNYIFCSNGKCTDSNNYIKYDYDPSAKEYNFKLSSKFKKDTIRNNGKLEFVENNKIKLLIFDNSNEIIAKNEFCKMKN